jgi:tripartite-type tricarboxylate transporter receptor subunit TctC
MQSYSRTGLAALGAVLFTAVAPAYAQTGGYPNKPVTIVVPFGAGGSADIYARIVAQRLQQDLGQPFVVEDRPGAGAVIGTQYVAKAAPDGYTLLLISNTQTVNESLLRSKPYQLMRDFVPVAPINDSALVLVTRSTLPAKTTGDLVKLAKSEPGKLNYASSGTGTPYHMAGEMFKAMAGLQITHIPYKSSGAARTDVMGGQVDMMFDAVTTMTDVIQSGKVRALATTGAQRSTVLPDLPTMAESGLPDYTATIWLGVLAPKGTPPAIVQDLNQRITKIVNTPQLREDWGKNGAVPMTMTPAEFGTYLDKDIEKWAKVVKEANIQPE